MEDRLHQFACVVEQGGFGKAAEFLHISQPALSIAVKKLEAELDQRLLERQGRTIKLTQAGTIVYAASKHVATQLENLKTNLAELNSRKPTIRIGMIDSMANILFLEKQVFSSLSRTADISLAVNNSRQLLQAVTTGRLDFAIITESETSTAAITKTALLGKEPLVLTVPKSQHKAYQRHVRQHRLPNFLSYNQDSFTRRYIQAALKIAGITAEVFFYSTSPEVMVKMVQRGKGAAILPLTTIQDYWQAGELAIIPLAGSGAVWRPIYLVQRQGRLLPPSFAESIDRCREALAQLQSEIETVL